MNTTLRSTGTVFAVWAAARATQRGLEGGSMGTLCHALEGCGVVEFLATRAGTAINEASFHSEHTKRCRSVVSDLAQEGVPNPTFGRAAKLVAIYLKAIVVVGPCVDTGLARLSYLPIDNILLNNISKAPDVHSPHKRKWGKVKWTKLNEEGYYSLIGQLRGALRPSEPFWALERYWNATDDSEI
jgi:hypothetical protein